MLFSVEQTFVGRDEKRAPLKRLRGKLVRTLKGTESNIFTCKLRA